MRWIKPAALATLLMVLAVISTHMVLAFLLGLEALAFAALAMLLFIQQRVDELTDGDPKYLAQNVSALVSTGASRSGELR